MKLALVLFGLAFIFVVVAAETPQEPEKPKDDTPAEGEEEYYDDGELEEAEGDENAEEVVEGEDEGDAGEQGEAADASEDKKEP